MDKKKVIYIGALLIVTVIVSVTYFSYAFFVHKDEQHGKLNIVTGTLDYSIKGEGVSNNELTLAAGEEKELILTVKSLNEINSLYELYYKNNANFVVGYFDSNDSAIGTINANSTKKIKIAIQNISDSTQEIEFGVQGGFVGQPNTLDSAKTSINLLYETTNDVLAKFNGSNLEEAILCDRIDGNTPLYLNCEVKNTVENALAAKNWSAIILTQNVTKSSDNGLTIDNNKDIILELNNRTITGGQSGLVNYGKLIMNNGTIVGNGTNYQGVCNNGNLEINNANIQGAYGIGCHNSNNATTVINDGVITSTSQNAIDLANGYTSELVINNATISGARNAVMIGDQSQAVIQNATVTTNGTAVYNRGAGTIDINKGVFNSATANTILNNSNGIININGGTFTGSTTSTGMVINNNSAGTINITDNNDKVYIGSYYNGSENTHWPKAVANNNAGTININGHIADVCNESANSNTTGICIYAYYRTIINDTGSTGTISINGASVVSSKSTALQHYSQTTKVKNTYLKSIDGNALNISYSSSVASPSNVQFSMCDSTLISGSQSKDVSIDSTYAGTAKYSNVIFSNGTTTPDSSKITDPNAKLERLSTCPF